MRSATFARAVAAVASRAIPRPREADVGAQPLAQTPSAARRPSPSLPDIGLEHLGELLGAGRPERDGEAFHLIEHEARELPKARLRNVHRDGTRLRDALLRQA